jgi:hypothetical protein
MSRTKDPERYTTLLSEKLGSLPADLPIFATLATAINMAVADIPRGSSDSARADALDAIDSAAAKILTARLKEIRNPEDLKDAFATLNANPECVKALLASPHVTDAVVQSAMEAAAASTRPESVSSFEILVSHIRKPDYQKILDAALEVHKPGSRNSAPFIKCVLKHMGCPPLQFPDQCVVSVAQAITAKTPKERAAAVTEAFEGLAAGKHGTSSNGEQLASLILRHMPKQTLGKKLKNWLFKTLGRIVGKKEWTETPSVTELIERIKAEVRPETAHGPDAAVIDKAASRSDRASAKPVKSSVSTPSTPTSGRVHATRRERE